MTGTLSPRKAPRQARSQATVDAILDATARVLVERGYAAANTNAVAARAGVSVGSLYQYFPNKDALISALHARHIRQMKAVIEHALTRPEAATLDEALQGLIGAAVEAHRVDAELHRVLETQLARHDDAGEEGKFDDTMQAWLVGLLQRYRGEIVVKDMRLGVFVLMHAVHSLIHAAVLEPPADTPLEAVVREIVRLVRAYLTAPGPRVAPPSS